MKLQIIEGMWNGFDSYYFCLDRINRIIKNFFACGERFLAEGHIIQAIPLILSNYFFLSVLGDLCGELIVSISI
jgi:hypothetical protein